MSNGNSGKLPAVNFPIRGILTTAEPVKTDEGDFTAFYSSTWFRMFLPNGMVDSWAVVKDQPGGKLAVLVIPYSKVAGFIAANHPGNIEDVYNADQITIIEVV